MNIHEKLAQIVRARGTFKMVDIGAGSLNTSILAVEKFTEFVEVVHGATVMLDASRYIPMTSSKKDIDLIDLELELEAGRSGGTEVSPTAQDPDFVTNELDAVKLKASTEISEDALEDNIQGRTLLDYLIRLMGSAGGKALERVFIYGDKSETGGSVPTGYKAVDGWAQKIDSGSIIYGGTGDDEVDTNDIDDIFTKMVNAMDSEYINGAVFYVPPHRERDYRRSLKARDTPLGDQANTTAQPLAFEGIPVIPVPALDKPYLDGTFFSDEQIWLTRPANLVHGLHRSATVKSDENILTEKYTNVISFRGDCHFENTKKSILCKPDTAAP